jgi:ubiquinone/menaquinone biosynthesis C-methylase UbiE
MPRQAHGQIADLATSMHATMWCMPSARSFDRVRQSYDAVAQEYARRLGNELAGKPLDRALLAVLIEQTDPGAPIADLGCGPGHVAAWLADHDIPVVGIDLSVQMVEIGRRDHPQVEFREGDLVSLPAADGEFGSVAALYSIIHLEPSEVRLAFNEIRRALRPFGLLLVAFHVGSEVRHLSDWWGYEVDVDFRFYEPNGVIELLEGAGFAVEARLERTSYPEEVDTRRAYVLARRRT